MFLESDCWVSFVTDTTELSKRRMSDFHQEQFFFHNTYLEIVRSGLVGIAFVSVGCGWDLFKTGVEAGNRIVFPHGGFLDREFRECPLPPGVYL